VADPEVQKKLDSKTDQNNKKLNWTKLLDWVHEAIIQNVAKLGPDDSIIKAKGKKVILLLFYHEVQFQPSSIRSHSH
jgi:hypothetical protein